MPLGRPTAILIVAIAAASGGFSALALSPQGNAPPATRGDEQSVRQAVNAYAEALGRGDLDAVLSAWAPDADYIDDAGNMTRGRNALMELFRKALPEMKGTTVRTKVYSVKFLRPDIALVDGSLEFTSADGSKDGNRYASVWTRTGDRWQISSARDLPTEASDQPSAAAGALTHLEWLVGEWQDASPKVEVALSVRWAPNHSFLLMDYTVKREGGEPMSVSQRIGWDPLAGAVRSWVFDTTGGFGEAIWERDGNRWVAAAEGILPDGGTGSATHVWEFVDANAFVWRSVDREVDGQPLPDIEVKFVRKAK